MKRRAFLAPAATSLAASMCISRFSTVGQEGDRPKMIPLIGSHCRSGDDCLCPCGPSEDGDNSCLARTWGITPMGSNRRANSIYRRIGYQRVAESAQVVCTYEDSSS